MHSSGVKRSSSVPMSFQRASTVRGAALRSSALSVANSVSMGFRSGESGGRERMCPPHRFNGRFDTRDVVTAYVVGDDEVAGVTRRA